jgi:hypothetical protein
MKSSVVSMWFQIRWFHINNSGVHGRSSTLHAFARPVPAKSLCSPFTFLLPKQLERLNDEPVSSLVLVLVVRSGLVIDHDNIGFVLIRLNHHQ